MSIAPRFAPPPPPPARTVPQGEYGSVAGIDFDAPSPYGAYAPMMAAKAPEYAAAPATLALGPPPPVVRRQRSRSFGSGGGDAIAGKTPYASLPRQFAQAAEAAAYGTSAFPPSSAAPPPPPGSGGGGGTGALPSTTFVDSGSMTLSRGRKTLARTNRVNAKQRSGTMAFASDAASQFSTTMAFGDGAPSMPPAYAQSMRAPPRMPPPIAPGMATMAIPSSQSERVPPRSGPPPVPGARAAAMTGNLPAPIAVIPTRQLPPGPPPGAPPLESRISRMPDVPMLVVRESQGMLTDESGAEVSLLGLLSSSDTSMPLIKALCAAALFEEQTLLNSVCRFLDPHKALRSVLNDAVDAEMAAVNVASNVFRDTNSPASMLLCTYATLVAQPYVVDTARTMLEELARDPATKDYDNVANIERWSASLLDTAAASLFDCPAPLAWLCAAVRAGSARRFASTSATVAVARFFFLRLICPALLTPVASGVLTREPAQSVARAIRQVCKVMKALANLTTFKNDVPMIPLNGFLQRHYERMTQVCDTLSSDAPSLSSVPPLTTLADADAVHMKYLRDLLRRKLAQVEQALTDIALIRKINIVLNA